MWFGQTNCGDLQVQALPRTVLHVGKALGNRKPFRSPRVVTELWITWYNKTCMSSRSSGRGGYRVCIAHHHHSWGVNFDFVGMRLVDRVDLQEPRSLPPPSVINLLQESSKYKHDYSYHYLFNIILQYTFSWKWQLSIIQVINWCLSPRSPGSAMHLRVLSTNSLCAENEAAPNWTHLSCTKVYHDSIGFGTW